MRNCGAPGIVVGVAHGRLLLTEAPAIASAWAANIWHDRIEWPVELIGNVAKALRGLQRNWLVLCAAASPACGADPGEASARLGEFDRFSCRRAHGTAGIVDTARPRPDAGGRGV